MYEPNQSDSHAGVLRAREHEPEEVFEFAGQKLALKGTSGLPKERPRIAEGRPIRHDVSSAAETAPTRATSGGSAVESRVAEGRPVQHRSLPEAAAGPKGAAN